MAARSSTSSRRRRDTSASTSTTSPPPAPRSTVRPEVEQDYDERIQALLVRQRVDPVLVVVPQRRRPDHDQLASLGAQYKSQAKFDPADYEVVHDERLRLRRASSIGSGFGGSVAALRLTEKGYRVGVLEAGRRWDADDYPEDQLERAQVHLGAAPRAHRPAADQRAGQMPGVQWRRRRRRLADLRQHALRAAAGVLPRQGRGPHITDWKDELAPVLRPGQADARRGREPARPAPRTRCCCRSPSDRGVADTFHHTDVGVFFNEGTRAGEVDDPYFGGAGPRRAGCIHCSECFTGCKHNAKNTTTTNYLYLAEAERRRGPPADHGHVGAAGRPAAATSSRPCGPTASCARAADVHRRAGGLRRGRARHPEAAAPAARRRHAAGAVAAARRADPQQLRGDPRRREPATATTSRRASRSRRRSTRNRRRTSRSAPTARARTPCSCRPCRWSTAARSGSCGSC